MFLYKNISDLCKECTPRNVIFINDVRNAVLEIYIRELKCVNSVVPVCANLATFHRIF